MKKNKFLEKTVVCFLNDNIIDYYTPGGCTDLEVSVFDLIDIHYYSIYEKHLSFHKDWPLICKFWKSKRFVEQPKYTKEQITAISCILEQLDKVYQPEQRSEEWYQIRNNLLTASDLATPLGLNPYSKRGDLVFSKAHCIKSNIGNSPAIIHGVKFEEVAVHIYSQLNNVVVKEYGCIPHPTLKCFGASPDGICSVESGNKDYIGRMLEIKCPKSRPITGIIPVHYELQIQGQLEVCNLNFCDFLECCFEEYSCLYDFIEDKDTQFKGAIFEYYNLFERSNKYIYLYDCEQIEKWIEDNIEKVLVDPNLEISKITYWKCTTISIVLVKRDKERFQSYVPIIEEFWKDVLKERENPYEEKEKKNYIDYPSEELTFLSDSN